MKKLFPGLLLIFTLILVMVINDSAWAASGSKKKVLIIVNDYIGSGDIIAARTPNLDTLIKKSATGLMNNRGKNKLPVSTYMSLAVGTRVAAASGAELSYNSGETNISLMGIVPINYSGIKAGELYQNFTGHRAPAQGVVNLFIEPGKLYAETRNPVYQPGQLGLLARQNHLRTGVLGNADTVNTFDRSAALLTMDENGVTPLGNVSRDLMEKSPLSPGGLRCDHQKIINNLDKLLKSCDIVVLDTGDTSRVESSRANCSPDVLLKQRQNAIASNDRLLGKIIQMLDLTNTMIVLVTPNPNADMVLDNNLSLTPVVIYKPGATAGLLTSPTTRRCGLVSNADLLPTIINYFNHNAMPGGISIVKAGNNSFEFLDRQLNFYINLRSSRNPLHYTFMALAVLMMIVGLLYYRQTKPHQKSWLDFIILSTLSMPLVFLFLGFTSYRSLPLTILISLLASFVIAYLLKQLPQTDKRLLLLTAVTAILIIFDCFHGSVWMLASPLGSDTIAGGRFYGLGNDYMGVLLAATVIATVFFIEKLKIKPLWKGLLGLFPLGLMTIAIGHPSFGADVGGLITSLVTMGLYFITISGTRFTWKRFILIGFAAVIGVLAVAELDALFSAAPSHAGKTINSLLTGGSTVFFSIVVTKLGILGSTIIHSSWSIILLIALLFILAARLKNPQLFEIISQENPVVYKTLRILSISTLIMFLVNDTGVIATAIILLYILALFGLIPAQKICADKDGKDIA